MQPSVSVAGRAEQEEAPRCRFCRTPLRESFADLGATPLANAYLTRAALRKPEIHYPLHAYVCSACFLVQVEDFQSPAEIFTDYAYFSSCSSSWLEHSAGFAASAVDRFALDAASLVLEIASNDGYLLQFFQQHGIPVLGVEPAANVAAIAQARGTPTLVRFFGVETARQLAASGQQGDLLVGNNVLAHVPDINDFVAGMAIALKPAGSVSVEFPHLLQLIAHAQFDTIYHEHFSYLSLLTVERIFAAHGLAVFDVEELPTHGGSLRVLARHQDAPGVIHRRVPAMRQRERAAGLDDLAAYRGFAERVKTVRRELLKFLVVARGAGKKVAAYGAAAKGNTLLNSAGVGPDLIDYVADISPHKQGLYLPGSRIPIVHPDVVRQTRPDYLLILPWNLQQEIMEQMADIRDWGGCFVLPIPTLQVLA